MHHQSAEYKYYASHLTPKNIEESAKSVDLNEWARLLRVDELFAAGGRYGIVSEYFKVNSRVEKLLEIGCGSGVSVAWMQQFADQCYGVDIYLSPQLRKDRIDACRFLEFNANDEFPIESGSFDAVVAMMVMEHVFDPFHFCQEVSRILRPSGTLFINIPLISALGHRLTLLTGRLPVTSRVDWFESRAWDGAHLHYFTLPLLQQLLELYGFELELVKGVGKYHRLKTRFPTLFAKEISLMAKKRELYKVGPCNG